MYTTFSKNTFLTAINVVIIPFIGFFIYRRKLDKIGIISSLLTLIGIGVFSLEADLAINIGDFLTGVLYLGVFSTTLGFLVQTICQKRVDGTKTAIILSTEAIFGNLFSIILLHEVITIRMIIGSIIICTSIIMSETKLLFLKGKKLKLDLVNIESIDIEY